MMWINHGLMLSGWKVYEMKCVSGLFHYRKAKLIWDRFLAKWTLKETEQRLFSQSSRDPLRLVCGV